MDDKLQLIVMLTYNDQTIDNAYEVFEQSKNAKAQIWGIKEKPLSVEKMKELFDYMKKCGKTTVLEVVAYTEEEGLKCAKMAAEFGCDILMGTKYFKSINDFCKKNNLKYMPFVGNVEGRPSILNGSIDEIIAEAKEYIKEGVFGLDLLGYRYTGDVHELNKKIVSQIDAPVCIAGNINNFNRIDELIDISTWAFTIGGAFFEKKFGDNFEEQINAVCEYVTNKKENLCCIA